MIHLLKKIRRYERLGKCQAKSPKEAKDLTSKQSIGWLSLVVTLTSCHFSAIPVLSKLLPVFVNNGVDECMLGDLRSSGSSRRGKAGSWEDLVTHFLISVLLELWGRGNAPCAVAALGGSGEGRVVHTRQLVLLDLLEKG